MAMTDKQRATLQMNVDSLAAKFGPGLLAPPVHFVARLDGFSTRLAHQLNLDGFNITPEVCEGMMLMMGVIGRAMSTTIEAGMPFDAERILDFATKVGIYIVYRWSKVLLEGIDPAIDALRLEEAFAAPDASREGPSSSNHPQGSDTTDDPALD